MTPTAQISHSAAGSASPAAPGGGAPAAAARPPVRRPARPWNAHPASVAAIGDSITAGFNACDPFSDCPEASWATGSRGAVDSLSVRLGDGARSWNFARSGAHVTDLPAQARAAAAHRPAMVTVLIGANDACAPDLAAMTSVADFRTALHDTLSYLHRTLPGTQILVASIPDLEHLWSVGRANPVEKQLWRLGLCPTMLKDADSQSAAARTRRAAVSGRVTAYDAVLDQECARYARCRYDGGAVHRYPFGAGDLSRWDWFHPNKAGQARLAEILAAVVLAAAS
ncbi:SGNH/GDSL hydrolase family protein [Streptomyces sp. V4-01]|uniref:SGNH/GDSL hydrolase family protein n=1 Tax=Actinacidiphila polyblastidii TaxID=3110430 RepID=A0ABU7PGQ5_9ACTN|nr:SGNH/GDSL hydrolase family protein [Streptomyces sp. V4-01]